MRLDFPGHGMPFLDQIVIRVGLADPRSNYLVPLARLALRLQHVSGLVMDRYSTLASEIVSRCRILASHSETPDNLTRTFLCDATQRRPCRYRAMDGTGWDAGARRCCGQ